MKGLVLAGFLDFVRSQSGVIGLEELLSESDLPSGGVYTVVGTYDASELRTLVARHAARTGTDARSVLIEFGIWLFPALMGRMPAGVAPPTGTRALLGVLDGLIHAEVRKLYPDAELPRFEARELGSGALEVRYRSSRGFADFAEGLIRGSIAWFGESAPLTRVDHDDGSTAFVLGGACEDG